MTPFVYYLPSYAAVAWYHKVLNDRPADLPGAVEEARKYAQGDSAALFKAATSAAKKPRSQKLSYFTGLSEDYLNKADSQISGSRTQRSRGLTTGRIDARFTGYTYNLLEEMHKAIPKVRPWAAPSSLINPTITTSQSWQG
jgi:hypothetical protein